MQTSESLKEFAPAFAKAQAEIESADKDRINPAFKSKYATLAACIEASRPALAKHGLAVLQGVRMATTGEPYVYVTTRILHASGEWIEEELAWPVKNLDSFGVGSGVTYARRVGYCGLVGVVADEDDDGAASVRQMPKQNWQTPSHQTPEVKTLPPEAKNGLQAPDIFKGSELPPPATIGPLDQRKLWKVARDNNWRDGEVAKLIKDKYNVSATSDLPIAKLSDLLALLAEGTDSREDPA